MEHLKDEEPDIVFVQETWLKSKKNRVTSLVKDYGYKLVHRIRKNREKEIGGGVGILIKLGMKFKPMKQKEFSSFEHITVQISVTNQKKILAVSIYRVLFISVNIFLEEFVTFLEMMVTMKEELIITGDINIHMDESSTHANKFRGILETFNMKQHVKFSTHKEGHTLDVIITHKESELVQNIFSNEYDVSHHYLINFTVTMETEFKFEKEIKFRKLRDINRETFCRDIENRFIVNDLNDKSFGEIIMTYNDTMMDIIDEHAPIIKKRIKVVPEAPWFDGEYANKRKQRRRAEKVYRRTGLQADKNIYINLRKEALILAHQKKCDYYSRKLIGNKNLFNGLNRLIDNQKETILPDAVSNKVLADSFLDYFSDKINKIRSTFIKDSNYVIDMPPAQNFLFEFNRTNEVEVRHLVSSYGAKCAPDDPMPSNVLISYCEVFIPIWTKLINLSFETGSMECLKSAIVTPLLKELDDIIDIDTKKNYRPVSNLQFLSKLIERVVKLRLNQHMTENNLHSDFEHGYKKDNSTETLLLKVVNDLLIACDNHHPTVVLLLDLSAAFDTVDQNILIRILEEEIGIKGKALDWFKSFLTGRTQKVKIGESYSKEGNLDFGMGQGTILSPDLFNIYIRSIRKIVERIKFLIFGFADDHQLLKKFLPSNQRFALDDDLSECFKEISKWMNYFFLRLNCLKTKILVFKPPSIRNELIIEGTFIENECIRFVHSCKNLGVILDDELTFEEQVTKVVQTCFLIIKKIAKVKEFLTVEQLRTVVSAHILSRLDYCNSLYCGINSGFLDKLQYVQNSASRLIYGSTALTTEERIRKCHWLKINERVTYKIDLTVHKCLYGNAPKCLSELLSYTSSERTRKLIEYKCNGRFGNRAFIRMGPKMWNVLPKQIRTEENVDVFKKKLKTYLFDNFENMSRMLSQE